MRVLFVYSEEDYYSVEKPLEEYDSMQFGISYISSVLRQAGHETRLVVPTNAYPEVVDEQVRVFNPGVICFTSVYTVFEFLSDIASRLKKKFPEVFLIIGGPHATLNPEHCLEKAYDAVCVGEGEFPVLELVEQIEQGKHPSKIRNLHIKKGNKVEINETRPFIQDLDSLPFPDRDMWLPWLANPISNPGVLLGRGCPYNCTYCCNHAIRKVAPGKYVRTRSVENIISEILSLKEKLPLLEEVYLEVETLGVNMKWALELCSALEDMNSKFEVPLRFGANLRVTRGADFGELFKALARSNFRFLNIGLESGSERIRKEVLKRIYSNEDMIRTVRTAKKYGLQIGFYNMIGLPGETTKDFWETVKLNRTCEPDWFLLSVFFPYPGTALHEKCIKEGLIRETPDPTLERRRPVLDQKGFSKRQVRIRYIFSHLLINGGKRPLREVARLVLKTWLLADQRLVRFWRWFVLKFRSYEKYFEKHFGTIPSFEHPDPQKEAAKEEVASGRAG